MKKKCSKPDRKLFAYTNSKYCYYFCNEWQYCAYCKYSPKSVRTKTIKHEEKQGDNASEM